LFDRNELTDFLKENKGEIPKNFGGYKQLFIDLWGRDIERHMPEVIERLHPTLRYVIEQHYLKNRSIREIAEHKKVSRSRIDQIKHQAYRSLRHPSRTQIKFNTYISPKKRDANIIKGLIEGSLLVDDLPLSVRAANCLKNAGIFDSATAFSGKTKDEGGWRITGTATVILICWIPMMVMCLRR